MTEPGRSTAEAETGNEPKATGDVINAIIGLMISLIVIGGVVGGAVFYRYRKRRVRVCSRELSNCLVLNTAETRLIQKPIRQS